jgi:exodeoxyribonuclease VII large subunit
MNEISNTAIEKNTAIVSVSELSAVLKTHIEDRFGHIRVRGEISGFCQANSGHVYFSLKDEKSILDAVCWRPTVRKLPQQLADGAEVIVTGRITTYPSRSRYQVVVEDVELAGVGALLKLLEERKEKLAKAGLFADERKQALPYLPATIGVVTSPTGAVIRDILRRLQDRFPRHVLVWPVMVQGQGAAAQVADAIDGFNRLDARSDVQRPDLIIVARGGGSLEDLWAFNEEVVVRAIASSAIPVISAVGHETDFTLADFAADVRASTPSAAAEIAVPVRHDLIVELLSLQKRMLNGTDRALSDRRFYFQATSRRLLPARRMPYETQQSLDQWSQRLRQSPRLALAKARQVFSEIAKQLTEPTQVILPRINRIERAAGELDSKTKAILSSKEHNARLATSLLESCSHKKTLARGFAIVDDGHGKLITSVKKLNLHDEIQIQFGDGSTGAVVKDQIEKKRKPRKSEIKKNEKNQERFIF